MTFDIDVVVGVKFQCFMVFFFTKAMVVSVRTAVRNRIVVGGNSGIISIV